MEQIVFWSPVWTVECTLAPKTKQINEIYVHWAHLFIYWSELFAILLFFFMFGELSLCRMDSLWIVSIFHTHSLVCYFFWHTYIFYLIFFQFLVLLGIFGGHVKPFPCKNVLACLSHTLFLQFYSLKSHICLWFLSWGLYVWVIGVFFIFFIHIPAFLYDLCKRFQCMFLVLLLKIN